MPCSHDYMLPEINFYDCCLMIFFFFRSLESHLYDFWGFFFLSSKILLSNS